MPRMVSSSGRGSFRFPAPGSAITYDDGLSGATGGLSQFSGLLDGYLLRPLWKVAGVDYAVGLKSNVSVDTVADTFTITSTQNNHINGQKVSVRTVNGGVIPVGTSLDTAYFVVGASGLTFQISATSGGSPIDMSVIGNPSGVVVLKIPVADANCMPAGVKYVSGQSHSGAFLESVEPSGAAHVSNGNNSAAGTINIDSYDFSWDTTGVAQHGISISTGGFNGTVNVKNCYFKTGDWLQCAIWQNVAASDIYNISYCEFDGGGLLQFGNLLRSIQHQLYLVPGGAWQYNWFHHTLAPIVASPSSVYSIKYNVVSHHHYGQQASHVDTIFPDVSANISGSVLNWNLFYQPAATVFGNGNGYPGECDTSFVLFLQTNNSLTLTGLQANNNTVIGLGSNHMNTTTQAAGKAFAIGFDIEPKVGNSIVGMEIKDNFVDSTGIETGGSFGIIITNQGAGTVSASVISGNKSMTTGATIAANVSGVQ